jgi:hypothetical protein
MDRGIDLFLTTTGKDFQWMSGREKSCIAFSEC